MVVSYKQIAQSSGHEKIQPPAPKVLRAIVDDVAPPAERLEVPLVIVTGIVIQVCGRQINLYRRRVAGFRGRGRAFAEDPAAIVFPDAGILVPPAAIAQMADNLAMGPGALFTPSFRPLKPHHVRQLLPIDRVKPTVLFADRHQAASC
jgi:hypothetical protein